MRLTDRASLLALGAIALWGSLAALGVALAHVPPFLLTGSSLLLGSLVALPLSGWRWQAWRVPLPTLALGVYGLFGFHFLLFMSLRLAPAVQANLVNYLWPLLMVLLSPVLLGARLRAGHVLAACIGFAAAALVILSSATGSASTQDYPNATWGYGLALGSALVWSSYSLLTQKVPPFPTAAIGSFAAVSGVLALLCHGAIEPAVNLGGRDLALLLVMGLGPMGGAFFLWDQALKQGDARQIGVLSYATPLLSTSVLMLTQGKALTWPVAVAALMMTLAAWLGQRASREMG